MTDLSIGNATLRIEVDGDTTKPALLLAHSLGSDLSQWDVQMPALLKSFRVIRYDSRGHGGSSVAGAPYSIAMLGRDAIGILDALDIETAHVMGVSMGGAVAQWLLVHAPGRITRAVLANTTSRFGTTASWNSRIVEVLGKGMFGLADGTMARWFGDAFAAREPGRIDAMRAVFEATAPEGYAGCCAAIRDLDLREALHAVTAPVLVISGQDDPSIAATDVATLVTTIPGAKHVSLDARHISNIEAEAAFTKAVVTFLTAKLPTKKSSPASLPATVGAKAIVGRRVGTRRSTAARIPLTAAPTSATASKAPTRKSPVVEALAATQAPASGASVRKASAAPAPAARAEEKRAGKGKQAGKPAASVKTPAVKVAAKPAPKAKVPAAKPGPTLAKRPSAKNLKAMAAGTATKAKTTKAETAKTVATTTVVKKGGKGTATAAPAARKVATMKAASRKIAPKAAPRAATAPVKPQKAKTAARVSKAPASKTSTSKVPASKVPAKKTPATRSAAKGAPVKATSRAPSAAKADTKAPTKTVVRATPPKPAPKAKTTKAASGKATAGKVTAKSGRRAS